MSQLYTVRMVSRKIISSFDQSGNKTGEREELIPITFHDLPHPTALAYKTKFPDAQVVITMQSGEIGGRKETVHVQSARRFGKTTAFKARIAEPEGSEDFSAAQTGDMAAAINAELAS
jgi:hypothetical protein